MAYVSWQFGPGGWRVVVANAERSAESTSNGDLPVAEMTVSITRYRGAEHLTSNIAMSTFGHGFVQFDNGPIAVNVMVSFVGDGFLNAGWTVCADAVAFAAPGKGHGKGLGENA